MTVQVSGLFGPDGKPVPPGEDLRIIAGIEEMKFWTPLQASRRSRLTVSTVLLVIMLVLGIAQGVLGMQDELFFYTGGGTAALGLILFFLVRRSAKTLEPDNEIVEVGKIHVPVDILPLPDGLMMVDSIGLCEDRRIEVRTLADPDSVLRAARGLGIEIASLNAVEPVNERHEYEGRTYFGLDGMILNLLGVVERDLAEFEEANVELPMFGAHQPLSDWIWENRTLLAGRAFPEVRTIEPDRLHQIRERLEEMCRKADAGADVIATSREALGTLDQDVLAQLEQAHKRSLALVKKTYHMCERTAFWPSFNFYAFEDEEQAVAETNFRNVLFGKMVYDNERDTWTCPSQNREVEVAKSVVINRFRDELFYPILDQFRASYHEEIMRIDRDLENRITQLQHDWQVKAQDLEGDLYKSVEQKKAELRRMAAQASALRSKIEGLTSTLSNFKRLSEQNRDQFLSESRRLTEEAHRKADAVCEKIDQEFAERKSEAYAQQHEIAEQNRAEDERRNREIVNSLHAMKDELSDKMDKQLRASMQTDAEKLRMREGDTFGESVGRVFGISTEKDKIKDGAAKAAAEA